MSKRILHPTQATLARATNPKVYGPDEWQEKLRTNDPFAIDLLAKPKIFLIGNDHDLAELVGHQP